MNRKRFIVISPWLESKNSKKTLHSLLKVIFSKETPIFYEDGPFFIFTTDTISIQDVYEKIKGGLDTVGIPNDFIITEPSNKYLTAGVHLAKWDDCSPSFIDLYHEWVDQNSVETELQKIEEQIRREIK